MVVGERLTVGETRVCCGVELSIVPPDPLSIVDADPCPPSNGCPDSKEINRRSRRILNRYLKCGKGKSDLATLLRLDSPTFSPPFGK